MSNVSNQFWVVYKKLEKEIVDLSYYIHFTDEGNSNASKQFWTYSNKIADLLVAICIQIESLFLELHRSEFGTTKDNIGDQINALDKKWNLSQKQVKVISKSMYFTDVDGLGKEFAPMGYVAHDCNDFYSAYCAVKHNRINCLHKANVNALIRSLAALFILNVYYSFETRQINSISEFDFSLGSDVFIAKYSVRNCVAEGIFIVTEDKEYIKKLSAYSDLIPKLESDEFWRFLDENPEPQRYTVTVNK